MNRTQILTILLAVLSFSPLGCFAQAEQFGNVIVLIKPNGIFDEETIDPSIYPDPDFQVYLSKDGHLYKMSFQDYKFQAKVPEGTYEIFLKSLQGTFISYKRANFIVSHSFTRTFKLDLTEGKEACDTTAGFVMYPIALRRTNNGLFSESLARGKSKPPRFDKLWVNKPLNLVINFCNKSSVSNRNVYEFARLTYDDITIYAHKIITDRNGTFFRLYGLKSDSIMIDVNGCVYKKRLLSMKLTSHEFESLRCQ